MTHPLTDEMCWEMAETWREKSYCDGMRAAADWQLEQVIEFLESESCSDYGGTLYYPTEEEDESIREALLRAMRPNDYR